MTKEISKLVSYNMKNGRIFAGIPGGIYCSLGYFGPRKIILKDVCEIQPNLVEKDYINRIRELYKSYKVKKREISIKEDEIRSGPVII